MAGFLGIDLDLAELRLAEVQQTAGGYQLHAALALPTGGADAASLGAQLKERLASVGFKSNAVVIALAHDAMTCREVRHPDIPAGELPAIVQFQVLKESAIPADDSIVDYIPLAQKLSTGERRSLTFVVRKSRVLFCEKLCEAAGLKLLAVVPRAVALFAPLSKKAEQGGDAVGYACSNSFFVVHNGELIHNHSMRVTDDADEFLRELRRSIAGYENQANMPSLSHVNLASHDVPAEVQEQLGSFRIPVQLYDPYQGIAGAERLIGHGDYAAACGAAQVTRAFKKPPVEFLSPKRVVVKPNRKRSYALIGGVAAAAIAFLVWGTYWLMTSSADEEIAALQDRIKDKKAQEKQYADAEVEKRFDAIKTWKEHELFILEEIYELTEIFPDIAGVQIINADWKAVAPPTAGPGVLAAAPTKSGTAAAAPALAKTTSQKPIARLVIKATAEQEDQLKNLERALKDSNHWKWIKTDPVPQEKNTVVYELDVKPARPEDFKSVIALGNNVTSTDSSTTNRPGARRGFRPIGGGRP